MPGLVKRPGFNVIGLCMWYVYICNRSGELYPGITTDLNHRMMQHKANLIYSWAYPDKHSAARRERQIKGWSRKKKLSLVNDQR